MNTFSRGLLVATALSASFAAQAELSANAGFVSDYYFRGTNLGDGGAYAGVDFESGGFYAGTWIIDDGSAGNDGLETDFYLGYVFNIDKVALGLGYTRYDYTYGPQFEHEINLTLDVDAFGFEYSTGEADDGVSGTQDDDYDFIALKWSGEVFGATLGNFSKDDAAGAELEEYSYIELSASGEVAGLDATISLGKRTNRELNNVDAASGTGYLVLDIGKSFDL